MRTTIQLDGGRRRSNSNSLFTYSYSLLAITPSPQCRTRHLVLELYAEKAPHGESYEEYGADENVYRGEDLR
jgi:hypothetical protein